MSSFNDTSGYTGDSTAYSEEIAAQDDMSYSRLEDVNSSTQLSFSPSRISTSDAELLAGSVSDEEAQMYDDDYTSGYESRMYDTRTYDTYDSRTYDDSFPQSPRSDDLSSTFTSFYLESDSARKLKSTVSFLRRPLFFFSLAMSGSGAVAAMCRVVYMVTAVATAQRRIADIQKSLCTLPEGYTNLPFWMHEARQALPSVVESTVKHLLRVMGIRSISDVQKEHWSGAFEKILKAKSEMTQITSGPMVPLVFFLPFFSIVAVAVAQHVIVRQTRPLDGEGEEEEEEELVALEADVEAEVKRELSSVTELNGENIQEEHNVSKVLGIRENGAIHPFKHEMNVKIPEESDIQGDDELHPTIKSSPSSQPLARPPSESYTNPHTMDTSRDLSPVSSIHGDIKKSHDLPDKSSSLTQTQASPHEISKAPYALQGNVVAAIVGDPSPLEVNVLLVAAARYNCQRLILPTSVQTLAINTLAPSLTIEYVEDVMDHVMDVEEPRGLVSVGVFLRPITDDTVELSNFNHPASTVYVFVPTSGANDSMVAHLVQQRTYASSSKDEPIPTNACFYDRSAKERATRK